MDKSKWFFVLVAGITIIVLSIFIGVSFAGDYVEGEHLNETWVERGSGVYFDTNIHYNRDGSWVFYLGKGTALVAGRSEVVLEVLLSTAEYGSGGSTLELRVVNDDWFKIGGCWYSVGFSNTTHVRLDHKYR